MTLDQDNQEQFEWPHSTLVVGCGLIGMSLAIALEQVLPKSALLDGVEVHPHHRELAASAGVFRQVTPDLPQSGQYDLVILAVPVDVACSMLESCMNVSTTIMDVCSVKSRICATAADLQLQGRFFPTHPMAGLASEGPARASANLFSGRPWIAIENWPVREDLKRLIEAVGAQWHTVRSPQQHDAVMAVVSHSVHVTSLSLMLSFHQAQQDSDVDAAPLCGPAFRDLTRLSASPSSFWTSTLHDNQNYTVPHLKRIIGELQTFVTLLESGDEQGLRHRLDTARAARQQWEAKVDTPSS